MTAIPETPPPGVALYDLDGTLLAWDCQLLFRQHVVAREPWRMVFLPIFLAAVPFAPFLSTARLKTIFLSFLYGMPEDALRAHARSFARAVMPEIYGPMRVKLEADRAAGRFLILASASPEVYVEEIGKLLGFDLILGTEVRHGGLFPPLVNNKAARKVERLRALLPAAWFSGETLRQSCGYTDSTADLPMLALCDTATVVNPKPALEKIAREKNWEIIRITRPWRSTAGFLLRVLGLLLGIRG